MGLPRGIIYNQSLEELTKRLEIRYNQNFEYDDEVKYFRYTFTMKNETLDEIIQLMQKITPIKTILKDKIIIFKKDKNRRERSKNKL